VAGIPDSAPVGGARAHTPAGVGGWSMSSRAVGRGVLGALDQAGDMSHSYTAMVATGAAADEVVTVNEVVMAGAEGDTARMSICGNVGAVEDKAAWGRTPATVAVVGSVSLLKALLQVHCWDRRRWQMMVFPEMGRCLRL
jgi:hypothetical protein